MKKKDSKDKFTKNRLTIRYRGVNMRGVLYYFSGTGNTKWVADKFKSNFSNYNIDLKLINIEDKEQVKNECFKKNDFIIVGSPVYAEFPPKIVCNFLEKIKCENRRIKAIAYSTQAAKSSPAAHFMAQCLKKKGFKIVIQSNIRMPNNYYFSIGKKPTKDNIELLLANSENKIKLIVKKFIDDSVIVESNSELRLHFSKFFCKIFIKKLPKLSKNLTSTDECGKCGICLMNCPQNNITFENGHAIFHSKCMLCMRCIHICPINAIRYKNKKIDQTQNKIINSLNLNK
ncbi:EFR1 family ferrodoxin [Clostridium tyrobutyricum]|uniref:EFR1 family ferrodoxin n=1 Tax=Clostridium tyrobutyricum TaxID=1519 RepID=UPI001FADE99A|nr:EFR1 family ferrodoxin [Clostridium tyrobutyricum]